MQQNVVKAFTAEQQLRPGSGRSSSRTRFCQQTHILRRSVQALNRRVKDLVKDGIPSDEHDLFRAKQNGDA